MRSSINYSDLDAPGVMRSPPLGFEQNLSARGSSHQFPRVQIRSDVHSANRNFSNPLRGRSPPSFQNSQLVGDQHPEREAPGRSDLHSGNRDFSNPLRGQSPPSFQNNQLFGGRHPEHEALRRPLSSPQWGNQSRPYNNRSTQLGLPIVPTARGSSQFGPTFQNRSAVVPLQNPARSPSPPNSWASPERSVIPLVGHKRSPVDYTDLDAPESKPSPPLTSKRSNFSGRDSRPFVGSQQPFSSPVWHQSQPRSSNTPSLSQENISPSLIGINQSGLKTEIKSANVPFPKRTRSPTPPYTPGAPLNSPFGPDAPRRSLNSQNYDHSSVSGQTKSIEVAEDELIDVPAVKKTKLPFELSPVQSFQENLNSSQESDRESQAKAKRLARFKDELSQPVNPTFPSQKQHLSASEKPRASDALNMNMTDDIVSGNPDYESGALSSSIVGLCSDMCPESERAERQRKGDLDQYERLDGDRNMSSESLAVKKYNRTAEREAELIRPLHILQKTMEYLLNLLHQPYSDKFLGLYNFLWDRMRAIRMDLRMQHLFNKEAIFMLEQMIRLHIIAMHELCEYTKGEGFSEGFDAHLNIEQMNKASVELFQLYDDHRKKLIHVPSEREFRGYYALLKLDKHPGYKVEPAELSLDLAKMTPEMRQTPEVMFARDVARACRTGNFITFFRLAKKSSYLQACLMHAHFSKLRTQALASLHCGLQTNQGIPMVQVAKWLGMEEEDIENLLEYYGFSIKDFNKEPFMVKDNVFINVDKDFPVKRSKLVEKKQSRMICSDVSSSSVGEFRATEKVNKPLLKKDPVVRPTPVTFVPPVSVAEPTDEEMHDHYTSPSPKRDLRRPIPEASMHDYFTITSPKHNLQKPIHEASLSETMIGHQGLAATPSPIIPVDSPKNDRGSQSRVESSPKLSYDPIFRNSFGRNDHESQNRVESSPKLSFDPIIRNSFGRTTNHYMESTPSITSEEIKSPTSPVQDSSLTDPSLPLFAVDLELEEQNYAAEEEKTDEETTDYYDEEIVEAKLRLILRIWKRLTTKKRELRERKLLAANAALSSLSLGPLIWQYETQPDNHEVFDIDNITSERREMQEKSWSVMNPAEVVATKLSEKSPDSKCLCWKLILCPEDGEHTVQQAPSAVYSWLYSKLIPTNTTDNPDLLVSSHNLGIWRNWSTSPAGDDPTLCLSVIKSSKIEDWNQETVGTSAILFVLSPHAPLTLQKNRLQNIFTSIPYSSRLPLLIVSGSSEDESDSSTIAKELETYAIENSRVSSCHIIFLKDQKVKNMGGFFSNERLLEGIEWLASESRSQIVIREVKTRELVLSNLNSTLNILENSMGPHNIICSFNESVERSIEQISRAVNANPTSWPCPEISFLEEKSDEYCAASWYLPRIGWSSTSRKEALISVLNNIKLPTSEDDLSFLSRGFSNGNAIESPKLQFENLLIKYLSETTQIMDIHMAEMEARIMLQKYTGLELQNSSFYIVPKWTSIFRRIFNWRLMNLASASTYVLAEDDVTTPESLNRSELEYSMCLPSFDELVKASYDYERCMSVDYEAFRPPSTDDGVMLMENEDEIFENGLLNDVNNEVSTTRSSVEADKLNEMLKKCNILQNQIDKKLSFYF